MIMRSGYFLITFSERILIKPASTIISILNSSRAKIIFSSKQTISIKKQRYVGLAAKLEAMSPLNVLCRGYAIASDADDTIIKTIAQVKPDDYLSIRVSDGQISAKVLNVKEKSYE